MQNTKSLKDTYCLRPFTNMDFNGNIATCCCDTWLPDYNAGDIEKSTLQEIWNSDRMQKLRMSILDGTYKYCNKEICPYLISPNFRLYTRNELQKLIDAKSDNSIDLEDFLLMIKEFSPWIRNILEGKVVLDNLPTNFNLCYDETCNLRCPSCRTSNIVHTHGEDYERRLRIHKKLFAEIENSGYENVKTFFVTGSGDPFASSIYRDFLSNFDGRKYPSLKFHIMTNGLLLTPEMWEKMNKIHSNIENIFISVDAANPETYKNIRVNGNFETLLRNLEFLGKKRKENKLKHITLAFVVQKKNYKEMADFIALIKKYNIDEVLFSTLVNWNSWELEEYYENEVCNPDHKEYSEFLNILRNPIFDDTIVNLGNITNHRIKALNS